MDAVSPGGAVGLPVWDLNHRWSTLGYALEHRSALSARADIYETENRCEAAEPYYLDFVEILFEVICCVICFLVLYFWCVANTTIVIYPECLAG